MEIILDESVRSMRIFTVLVSQAESKRWEEVHIEGGWIKDIDISLRTLLHFKSSRSQETQRQFTLFNHQKVFLECTKFLVWHNIYKLGSVKIKRHRLIICTTFQLRDAPQNQSCNFDQDGGGFNLVLKKLLQIDINDSLRVELYDFMVYLT